MAADAGAFAAAFGDAPPPGPPAYGAPPGPPPGYGRPARRGTRLRRASSGRHPRYGQPPQGGPPRVTAPPAPVAMGRTAAYVRHPPDPYGSIPRLTAGNLRLRPAAACARRPASRVRSTAGPGAGGHGQPPAQATRRTGQMARRAAGRRRVAAGMGTLRFGGVGTGRHPRHKALVSARTVRHLFGGIVDGTISGIRRTRARRARCCCGVSIAVAVMFLLQSSS